MTVLNADAGRLRGRLRSVGAARLWAHAAWRGGIGGLSCYDEAVDTALLPEIMDRRGIDAAVVVGADWALVDPALIDACARCYLARPDEVKVSFTQAPPGLAGALLTRATADSLAGLGVHAAVFGTIGGSLSYVPTAPQNDPIARDYCVRIEPSVRDAGSRFVPDTRAGRARVRAILSGLGSDARTACAAAIASHAARDPSRETPRELVLEACTGRLYGGPWQERVRAALDPAGGERGPITASLVEQIVGSAAAEREDLAVTFHGVGDPLLHPRIGDLVGVARRAGASAVHVRTDLLRDNADAESVLALDADVVSIDLLASTPETHARLTGSARYNGIVETIEALAERTRDRTAEHGIGLPWIVPRMTKCDDAYEDLERFYSGWIVVAGSAVIDPPLAPEAGERLSALPAPPEVATRLARERLVVRSDGSIAGLDDAGPAAWEDGIAVVVKRLHRVMRDRVPGSAPGGWRPGPIAA